MRQRFPRFAFAVFLNGVVSCKGDAGTPSPVEQPPLDAPLARVEGDPSAPAIAQLPKLGPFVASADQVLADGLISTRLSAAVAEETTLEELNQALATTGSKLSMTRGSSPFVSIEIAAVTISAAATLAAQSLLATAAFASVRPAFTPSLEKTIPGTAGLTNAYLGTSRFLSAWNAESLASTKIAVRCADSFVETTAAPQLPGLKLAAGTAAFTGVERNADGSACDPGVETCTFSGNHGFWTMSILGASIDDVAPSGTSPDPARLLDVECVQSGGLAFPEVMTTLAETFPASGPIVVSISLAYSEHRAAFVDRVQLASDALQWRSIMSGIEDRVLVLSAAGNDGQRPGTVDAELASPFSVQSRIANLETFVPEIERPAVQRLFESARRKSNDVDLIQGQSLIVGASRADGTRFAITQRGEDVRMLGEAVTGLCVRPDAVCGPDKLMIADGTSGSTPLAAGLAAYLWSIDPTLVPASIKAVLLEAFDGTGIDAFNATLAIEGQNPQRKIRETLLDVNEDGAFTEADIDQVLAAIDANESFEPNVDDALADFSREDLNGDGFTRGDSAVAFDLSIDRTPTYSSVSTPLLLFDMPQQFDERGVTDIDVLCFYAASSAFTGDTSAARATLVDRCDPDPVIVAPWVGTIDVTVTEGRSTELSCNQAETRSSTMMAQVRISCPAFDPFIEAVRCDIVDGTVSGSTGGGTPLAGWFPGQSGGASCNGDSDCTDPSTPVCVAPQPELGPDGFCGYASDPSSLPGGCVPCETYSNRRTTYSGGGSAVVRPQPLQLSIGTHPDSRVGVEGWQFIATVPSLVTHEVLRINGGGRADCPNLMPTSEMIDDFISISNLLVGAPIFVPATVTSERITASESGSFDSPGATSRTMSWSVSVALTATP